MHVNSWHIEWHTSVCFASGFLQPSKDKNVYKTRSQHLLALMRKEAESGTVRVDMALKKEK